MKQQIKRFVFGSNPETERRLVSGQPVVVFRKDQIGKYDFSKDDTVLCVFRNGRRMLALVVEEPRRMSFKDLVQLRKGIAQKIQKQLGNLRPLDVVVFIRFVKL